MYDCSTYCRPPQPLRVGEYRTLQWAAAHVSFRLGMVRATAGHTRNLHSIDAHDVGNTFASYASAGNRRDMAVHVRQHTRCL
jgi:hypothetical protein